MRQTWGDGRGKKVTVLMKLSFYCRKRNKVLRKKKKEWMREGRKERSKGAREGRWEEGKKKGGGELLTHDG